MTYRYIDGDGNPEGPLSLADIQGLFSDGLLNRKSQVSRDGGDFKEARHFPELQAKAKLTDMHLPSGPAAATSGNPSGFVLFVVLALLIWPLGLIGAIAFLCEEQKRSAGFALLAISVASGILGWLFIYGRYF